MFSRYKCVRCNEKISKKYNFCPHCGISQKEGAQGEFFEPIFKLGFPFNKLFKDLEKQIEMQFQEMDARLSEEPAENPFAHGISINIDTTNGQPTIKINQSKPKNKTGSEDNKVKSKEKAVVKSMSEEKFEKYSQLNKEEPATKVRRFNNKLVYEITLPEVSDDNLSITKFENSIEVKAFSDNKAFFKLIPLSLPIIGSELKEGVLNLELKI